MADDALIAWCRELDAQLRGHREALDAHVSDPALHSGAGEHTHAEFSLSDHAHDLSAEISAEVDTKVEELASELEASADADDSDDDSDDESADEPEPEQEPERAEVAPQRPHALHRRIAG